MNSWKEASTPKAKEINSKKSLKSSSVKIPSSILWNRQYRSMALFNDPISDRFRYEPIILLI